MGSKIVVIDRSASVITQTFHYQNRSLRKFDDPQLEPVCLLLGQLYLNHPSHHVDDDGVNPKGNIVLIHEL